MTVGTRHSISQRRPDISAAQIVAHLVPPRQFREATFESYRPDPEFPPQAEAVERMQSTADAWTNGSGGFSLFRKRKTVKPGIYLDGGFGVGKTHLLAALFKVVPGRTYFGTFIEYTALVGALGYRETVQQLTGAALICIDEFELDDPGDTMVMTRLLGELIASGTNVAATSNTPPNALGEGRFAAQDFLREITAMADSFEIMRIDGNDYRQRDITGDAVTMSDDELDDAIESFGGHLAVDGFDALVTHLSTVHPSRYVGLVEGLDAVALRGVHQLTDQTMALRLVALVDRLYDAQVRIFASGLTLSSVFSEEMLGGGYRKKYLRAVSRMIALTSGEL